MWHFGGRGRRTGLQPAATEQRDEWGMEPLESLPFSPDSADSRDHIDPRDVADDREKTNVMPSEEGVVHELSYNHSGFEIAQPLFGDPYSREMDIREESPLLAWQTRSSRPKSTSVGPSPAATGHDADTSEDIYECIERSSPLLVAESPVLEEEVLAQSSPQSIHPDRHNAVSQPCLQNDRNATVHPRKRGRPREVTGDSNISQEQQTHASSNNVYESFRQKSGKQMVQSSHPLPKPRGRRLRRSRQKGQNFSDRRIQRIVKTMVRSDDMITRSGRKSIPPISIWRGDKIVEGKEVVSDTARQGHFVVPTVGEVIRAPDNIAASSKDKARKKRKGGSKDSTQKAKIMQQDEWEMIAGRKSVTCRLQESEEGDDASDGGVSGYYNLDVAFSSGNILGHDYPRNKVHWGQVKVPDFSPFGLMNMPPGTEKSRAHAKTANTIFLVHDGQVTITINKESFTVSTGSAFVVPKDGKALRAWEVQAQLLAALEVDIPGY
ncbi:hypothetical protein BFJ63_vAg16283 [Fusarium oxysporum f. sp. narcissi]|uniref:Mif2/CENP-C cupin domain-containing protein n=1 Tax=Fusarium oxysporum f. sp. narcissi TaxID=451672 RepID=A0A4Q2V3J8_FUSOX|nr:hypothetical protein BFJ63_vAg16283 [Fusarium oxysporum f. sp. narcissi]